MLNWIKKLYYRLMESEMANTNNVIVIPEPVAPAAPRAPKKRAAKKTDDAPKTKPTVAKKNPVEVEVEAPKPSPVKPAKPTTPKTRKK